MINTADEIHFTYFQIDFNNFQYNDGDYIICRNLEEVYKILQECEHILDEEYIEDEDELGDKIIIKKNIQITGIPMTKKEYENYLEKCYQDDQI